MELWIGLALGLMIGTTLGVFVLAMMIVAKEADRQEEAIGYCDEPLVPDWRRGRSEKEKSPGFVPGAQGDD